MTHNDVLALLPFIVVAGASVLAIISIAIRRSYRLVFGITVVGLLAALTLCGVAYIVVPRQVTMLLLVDPYALYFLGLFLAAAFVIALLSYDYWHRQETVREEYYILLLFGTLGAMVLAASTHFATLFLGLELLSSAIYILAAYSCHSEIGTEAGIKYLVLAGVSSAFILFGMALVYAALGTMQLAEMSTALAGSVAVGPLVITGLGMILVGLSFKLALFPFFLWAPDVFEGAPAIVTAFIATISKGAIFVLLVRYFIPLQFANTTAFSLLFTILAITTMVAGNVLALLQNNLKRLLAYSSIAHLGYLLVAFIASGRLGIVAISFYLTAYFVTTLGAFGVITAISGGRQRDVDQLASYQGLAWRHPWLTGVLTACLFSLAGLPLTAGFIGKFLLVVSGVGARLWALVIIFVLNSGVSLYYYLRVVGTLYRHPEAPADDGVAPALPAVPWLAGIVLVGLVVLLVWFGVYPSPVLRLIGRMMTLF